MKTVKSTKKYLIIMLSIHYISAQNPAYNTNFKLLFANKRSFMP